MVENIQNKTKSLIEYVKTHMFKTREIAMGPIFRAVIGALAVIDIIIGLPLTVREFWFAVHGEWIRLFTAGVLLYIFYAGVWGLRSAIRGRISVRSHSRKRNKTGNIENGQVDPSISNKKKQQIRQMKLALQDISNKLSEEIWEGKWDHIPDIHTKPIGECTEILQEIERRCPGHTTDEYKDAIARSMFTWR